MTKASNRRKAKTRQELMEEHRAARARRDSAALGSDEYRAAAEEVARIEIAISELEEPDPEAAAPPDAR